MIGRAENPLPTTPSALCELAARLREIRTGAGSPVYRTMAKTGLMTASALSQAAGGHKYPTWECVEAYLRGCHANALTVDTVRTLWEAAEAEKNLKKKAKQAAADQPEQGTPQPLLAEHLSLDEPEWPGALPPMLSPADGPRRLSDFNDLADVLRTIMERAGLTAREVIARSEQRAAAGPDGVKKIVLKKTTVYNVLNGTVTASETFTRGFLQACDLPTAQINAWIHNHQALQRQQQHAVSALKALRTGLFPDDTTVTIEIPASSDEADRNAIDAGDTSSSTAMVPVLTGPVVSGTITTVQIPRQGGATHVDRGTAPVMTGTVWTARQRRIIHHRRPALLFHRGTCRIEISEGLVLCLLVLAVVTTVLIVHLT